MTIQLNADNNLNIHESFGEKLREMITKKLDARFGEYITRIEVHLSDENADKPGENDKKCIIEARLAGRNPIAVTGNGDTHETSTRAAIEKLVAALDTSIGRLKNH